MKKEEIRKLSFKLGLLISIISIFSAFLGVHHWHFPAVIGVWLIFDYFSSTKNKKTAFSLILNKKWKKFLQLYLLLAIIGVLIELIGQYFLGFWFYPELPPTIMIILIPIFYPFILMSFREMYETVKIKLKKNPLIPTTLLAIVIWEVPNLISKDWIYTVPLLTDIFGLNAFIILLWPILIILPISIYRKLL